MERGVKNSLYINSKCILTYPKPNVHVMPRRNFSNPRGMRWSLVKYCAYVTTVLEMIFIAYMGSRLFYRYLVVTKIA